jgi:hypothetical protein
MINLFMGDVSCRKFHTTRIKHEFRLHSTISGLVGPSAREIMLTIIVPPAVALIWVPPSIFLLSILLGLIVELLFAASVAEVVGLAFIE